MSTNFDKKCIEKEKYIKLRDLYDNKKFNSFIILANEYLDEYPNDILIRFRRAKVLRHFEKFNLAIVDLKYILSIENNNIYALTELFFIYYYLNKYDDALKMLPKMYEYKVIKGDSLAIAELVMRVYLGMDYTIQENKRCEYIRGQIIDYNRYKFIQVLNNNNNEELNKQQDKIVSYFHENIDLNYLVQSVELNLKKAKRVNKCEIMDIYYFGISNVGYSPDNVCNYVKVIVVPNTKHIVGMYPVFDVEGENILPLDCDRSKLFKRNDKVKTLSRINRFKEKYNM